MGLQQVIPAADPLGLVSLAAVKAQCTVESDDWDALLTGYVAAALAMAEAFTGQAFGAQTWLLSLDRFCREIELSRGPVTGITSVIYLDSARVLQTLSPAVYILDLISAPQRIVIDPDQQWPATAAVPNAVNITFQTGYVAMPAMARQAVLMTVASWFANREVGGIPANALELLRPMRGVRI